MTLPCDCRAAGHDDAQRIAELDGVGLGFRQRRVDPGLGQVHDGDDGRAGGNHFSLARGADVDLAVTGRKDLGVAQLDFGLVGQGAGVLCLVAGFVHGSCGYGGEQLVSTGLA